MNRSQRIYDEMYLLQESPTPQTPELPPQPVSAPVQTQTQIQIVHTDSRKRKRCELTDYQYTIYPSPVINVA